MKQIQIGSQTYQVNFTSGPWDTFIHGHITSMVTGKLIAKMVDQGPQALAWAFNQHRHLMSNTQKLISLAPDMFELVAKLLLINSRVEGEHRLGMSDYLVQRIQCVLRLAVGGSIDSMTYADLQETSKFLHDVVLDQSLLIDHLPGPWQLCGESYIRWKSSAVVDVNANETTTIPWAAKGDLTQQQANRCLIAVTLELAACLLVFRNGIEQINQSDLSTEDSDVIKQLESFLTQVEYHYSSKLRVA